MAHRFPSGSSSATGVCSCQEHRHPLRRARDGVLGLRQLVRHAGLGDVRDDGVAATFYAAVIPHITKLSVASKLAEAEPPVACPPQWLPVLLASLKYPTSPTEALEPFGRCNDSPFVIYEGGDDTILHLASAVMVPATVSFNGKPKGWPIGGMGGPHECDEMASVGPDGTVRGKSHLIVAGFSLGILGADGEMIEFRYYSAAEKTTYYSDFRYEMKNNDQIGKNNDQIEWYWSL